MNNIHNLSIVIVTSRTDENILIDCLNSIDPKVNILVVENSKNNTFKDKLESKYSNLNVILSGVNLGYGAGNNLGLSKVKTRYALILNPDVILEKNFFEEINNYLDKQINFHIMGVNYKDDDKWKSSGTFSEFDSRLKLENKIKFYSDSLEEVDWVIGCAMLINLEKFETRKLFDENIFLYFEEIDFCRQTKINGGKVYSSRKLIVKHLGHKGSAATDPNYTIETEMFRNWHWMWSSFYYHKKYSNYFLAIKIMSGKFIKSFFKMIFFSIIYNKKKQTMYFGRYSGLLNAFMGKKSWYRVKSLFK